MIDLSSNGYKDASKAWDLGGSNPGASLLKRYQTGLAPGLQSELDYQTGLQRHQHSLIDQLLGSLTQSSLDASAKRKKAGITQDATEAAGQGAMTAKGLGLGDGAQGGLLASILGSGQRQASQVDAQYHDPQYVQGLISNALGITQQGMQPNFLQQLLSTEGPVMGQNQFNEATKGHGILGDISGILGEVAGSGGFGNFFKKKDTGADWIPMSAG